MNLSRIGFWSYVRLDDDAESGRVVQLGRDVAAQFEAMTGEDVALFIDRDTLEGGDAWRDEVDGTLANLAFFVAVLSPRFFQSPECRRELTAVLDRATEVGSRKLVFPILYYDVPELHEKEATQPLIRAMQDTNWADWRPLRNEDPKSSEYRKGVTSLVEDLIHHFRESELREPTVEVAPRREQAGDTDADDEEPGDLDILSDFQEASEKLVTTLAEITATNAEISNIMVTATGEIVAAKERGQGAPAALVITKRVARDMEGPAEKMVELSLAYSEEFAKIDRGVRLVLEGLREHVDGGAPLGSDESSFVSGMLGLADATDQGVEGIEKMVAASQPLERQSRDLRAPIRKMRLALTSMAEARVIVAEWRDLAAGLDGE